MTIHRGYIVPFEDFCKCCNYHGDTCLYEDMKTPSEMNEQTCPIVKNIATVEVREEQHPELGSVYFAYFKDQLIGEVV